MDPTEPSAAAEATPSLSAGPAGPGPARLTYPPADRDDVVEVLHGVVVTDPYRYLEDPDGPRTAAFVTAQNAVSAPILAALPGRTRFAELVGQLLAAPRPGVPWQRGGRYFALVQPGGLDQDVLVTADTAAGLFTRPRVLLDPNSLSTDGTVALQAAEVTRDGRRLAYALAEAGSDWHSIHVRDVATGQDEPDVIEWTKWVPPTWLPDGRSFLYWRYPGVTGGELTGVMGTGELVRHVLGTDSAQDELIWSRPTDPEWVAGPVVSPDGNWLILVGEYGTDSRTTVSARRLRQGTDGLTVVDAAETTIVGELTDAYWPVAVVGDGDGAELILRTEHDAERGRLVAATLTGPLRWREVRAEHPTDKLAEAALADGAGVLLYLHDAAHRVELTAPDFSGASAVDLPGPAAVTAIHTEPDSPEIFLGLTRFTAPLTVFRIDAATGVTQALAAGGVDLPEVAGERRTARSADGTAVPMTVLRRADAPAGPRPALLYGYGGFDIPVLPEFRAIFAAWVAAGGTLAVASLRGGGEFGVAWHRAGMLADKQRVFDDAIGCAEALIADGLTTRDQLAVHGRSNGGLLVGALLTQRPDLFAATLPTVGVLDMLRFHRFTIGRAWTTEYGDPDDAADFAVLHAYSPLHRLRPGTPYPPTLICTGDHDDRVVPAHSLKFGAELQRCQAGDGPVLLRVDTRAGHGMGKPVAALTAEYAEQLAFAAAFTGLDPRS